MQYTHQTPTLHAHDTPVLPARLILHIIGVILSIFSFLPLSVEFGVRTTLVRIKTLILTPSPSDHGLQIDKKNGETYILNDILKQIPILTPNPSDNGLKIGRELSGCRLEVA